MSRIGKMPIELPDKVTITVDDDNLVTVKGPKESSRSRFTRILRSLLRMAKSRLKDHQTASRTGHYTDLAAL